MNGPADEMRHGHMQDKELILPVRVYYEDTDAGGVVYHANYVNFMERARTEFMRHLGFELDILHAEQRVLFVVRKICVDYLKPARFNHGLHVTARVKELGRSSIVFAQQVKSADGNTLFADAEVVIVSVDADKMRPCKLPQEVVERAL